MTHRFTVYTKSNPSGDDVGADDCQLADSGALVFIIDGMIQLAYASHEWTQFEYGYEEETA